MNSNEPDSDSAPFLPLDSLSGPAQRRSEQKLDAIVQAALDSARKEPPLLAPRRKRRAWAAAAIVVVAGSAAASLYIGTREARETPPAPAPPSAIAVRHAEPPPVEPAAAPSAAPELAEPKEPPLAERNAPLLPRTPEDWLERANGLRRRGHFAEAERAYARVYEEYPGSLSAYVARVAGASLRLDYLGDPRGAERLFEAARKGSPGGALDIEVRQGLAEAARRQGNAAREREALSGLVATYPKSPAADRARKRLSEL